MIKTKLHSILIAVLIFPSYAFGGECGHINFVKEFKKNTDVEHKGYYFQPTHCFSVIIPDGIIGRTSSQPSSQHGFGAVLPGEEYNDYLLVEGDFGASLENPKDINGSLAEILNDRIKWLKDDKAILLKKKIKKTKLGSLSARRMSVIYKCPGSKEHFIQDSIFAMDKAGSDYEISLLSIGDSYNQNRPILDQIALSWKLEPKKCEELYKK